MSEEEKLQILSSAKFQQFFEFSSKIMERQLAEEVYCCVFSFFKVKLIKLVNSLFYSKKQFCLFSLKTLCLEIFLSLFHFSVALLGRSRTSVWNRLILVFCRKFITSYVFCTCDRLFSVILY